MSEKHDENIEMKSVMLVETAAETLETEQAVVKQIVSFAMKDVMPDAIFGMKRVAVLIVTAG
jgi:hypothetical protein